MNAGDLLAWVNDTARTQTELQAACRGLGLKDPGTAAQLRNRLRMHLAAKKLADDAGYDPTTRTATSGTPEERIAALERRVAELEHIVDELGEAHGVSDTKRPLSERALKWLKEH